MEYGAVPQCLHSGYKLLLQLPHGGGKNSIIWIRLSSNGSWLSKGWAEKTILKVLEGHHCFISLPTGYGKSLIFQVLRFAIEYYRRYEDIPQISFNECSSIVLVISPLLALMEEQCKALHEKGVTTAYVGTYNHYINMHYFH